MITTFNTGKSLGTPLAQQKHSVSNRHCTYVLIFVLRLHNKLNINHVFPEPTAAHQRVLFRFCSAVTDFRASYFANRTSDLFCNKHACSNKCKEHKDMNKTKKCSTWLLIISSAKILILTISINSNSSCFDHIISSHTCTVWIREKTNTNHHRKTDQLLLFRYLRLFESDSQSILS